MSKNVYVEVLLNSWCVCYAAITVGITVDITGASSEGDQMSRSSCYHKILVLKANIQLHNP